MSKRDVKCAGESLMHRGNASAPSRLECNAQFVDYLCVISTFGVEHVVTVVITNILKHGLKQNHPVQPLVVTTAKQNLVSYRDISTQARLECDVDIPK
eukprot:m.26696 g.26696  ORF g.26696 m.26696 type:complete len:98 (-) comp8859_c0_seq2:351-644(-)